jgi:hypothetical protein
LVIVQLLVLALLIGDTAAGLASGLAGSLAFAATAILRALTQIAGLDGLNVFHDSNLHKKCSHSCYHILPPKSTRQKRFGVKFFITLVWDRRDLRLARRKIRCGGSFAALDFFMLL